METILLNTFEPQNYENRKIRLSGTEKNLQHPSKWINKTEKWHWIYTFIYLDTKEIIKFEFDYYDTYTSKRNT